MSLVDRAGPVSEISPYLWILCKIFDVFIWGGGLYRLPRSRFFRDFFRLNLATSFTKEALDILKISLQRSSGAIPVQMFSHHKWVRPGLY